MRVVLAVASCALVSVDALGGDREAVAGAASAVGSTSDEAGRGIIFVPTPYPGDRPVELLDPEGVAVHMTKADDPGRELSFPAGWPFLPPPGPWRVWLQSDWSITPYNNVIFFPRIWPDTGITSHQLPIAPGGKVEWAEGAMPDGELWLLHVGEHPWGIGYEFSRRIPLIDLADGILMPPGPVVAGLWNSSMKRLLALSRPFLVRVGRSVAVPVRAARATDADLIVFARRPMHVDNRDMEGHVLVVRQRGEEYRPDLTLPTLGGVYAIWYDLPQGSSMIEGSNDSLYLERHVLDLRGGSVERLDAELLRRPRLEVTLILPGPLRKAPLQLMATSLLTNERVAAVDLPRTAGRHTFDRLTGGPFEIALETIAGTIRQQVELKPGEETFVTLEPDWIEVFGTVTVAGEPQAATVRFQTVAGDWVEADSVEDGTYTAVALQPLRWVDVRLDSIAGDSWTDTFAPPIRASQKLDIEIPDGEAIVHVVNAVTGEGIADAFVDVRNEYFQSDSETAGDARDPLRRQRMIGRSHRTNSKGSVRLPPPRPGRLEISASAAGYRRLEEPLTFQIEDPPQDLSVEVPLVPVDDTVELHLTLPNGEAAVNAEVVLTSLPSLRAIDYSGRADSAGVVRLPRSRGPALVLLRHPEAASGILEWRESSDIERVEWTFSPTAEAPFLVQVVEPGGQAPVGGAGISLWIGQWRLSGWKLSWLLDTRPNTSPAGLWRANRLPGSALRILASVPPLQEDAEVLGFESLATEVSFPWPAVVRIEAVQ